MTAALLLAAHGSHLDPRSSQPARAHAAALRAMRKFDDVLLGFWKEEPALSRALDGTAADAVVVVPFFMADGYFTRVVLPAELGLAGRSARAAGPPITIGPPLGTLPEVAGIVAGLAREQGAGPRDTVVVLGHGTPRTSRSAAAAATHAQAVSATREFGEVVARYLDQEPSLAQLPAPRSGARTVVVPLFVSEGWHVGTSIPDRLSEHGRDDVAITPAVGTHPSVPGLLAAIAHEALAEAVTA